MSKDNFEHTKKVDMRGEDKDNEALLSGDPAYITSHNHARSIICQLERDGC